MWVLVVPLFLQISLACRLNFFRQEPAEADFASKEDLERWAGGGKGAPGDASRGATEAAERAREAVAKASKVGREAPRAINRVASVLLESLGSCDDQ